MSAPLKHAGENGKLGELIDIKEISPLTLTDRRIYNLLIANAWDRITEPVEHVIDKSDLRGTHNGNERIEDSIRPLMSAIAEVKEPDSKAYPRASLRRAIWMEASVTKASRVSAVDDEGGAVAILGTGGVDDDAHRQTEVSTRAWILRPFTFLPAS